MDLLCEIQGPETEYIQCELNKHRKFNYGIAAVIVVVLLIVFASTIAGSAYGSIALVCAFGVAAGAAYYTERVQRTRVRGMYYDSFNQRLLSM